MPTATLRIACRYTIYISASVSGLSTARAQAPVTAVVRPMFAPAVGNFGQFAMAYDSARECVVLHDPDTESTWEWYGAGWQRRAFPAIWAADAMTFGSSDPRCLAMDSRGTWAWDGEAWSQVGPSLGFAFDRGFAHDSHRDRTVSFGGFGASGWSDQTWEFDGTTWQHVPTTIQPPANSGSSMVFDSVRGCMVVVAGADTWEWDGSSWTRRQPVNSPGVGWFGMAFDTARGVTVMPTQTDVWEWDGVNWTSTPASGGPQGTVGRVAYDAARAELIVVEARGRIATWSWDGAQWTRRLESSSALAYDLGMATDQARQRVVAFGGLLGNIVGTYASDATLEWHDGHWRERHPNTVPLRRTGAALCYDSSRSRIMMFGGDDGGGWVYNDLWSWDGNDWTATPSSAAPPPRRNMAIAYDPARDRIVLFGGGHGGRNMSPPVVWADTWEWDGTNWSQITPTTSPAGRFGHHMAYDASRGRTVLFGGETVNGLGTVASDETWEWDGSNWLLQRPTNRPPGGSAGAMMFDPARGKVLFYYNDLWQWDGTNWTAVPTAGTLPTAYWTPSAAIEPTTGAVLVPSFDINNHNQYVTLLIGDVAPATSTTTGSGCAGSVTTPYLRTTTPLLGDMSFRYELGGAPPSSQALLVWALTSGSQSIAGCTLHLGPPMASHVMATNSFGVGTFRLPVPSDPLLRGLELHAQGATLDPGSARGFALSNAQRIRIGDGE